MTFDLGDLFGKFDVAPRVGQASKRRQGADLDLPWKKLGFTQWNRDFHVFLSHVFRLFGKMSD